jgi:hypothetical protein
MGTEHQGGVGRRRLPGAASDDWNSDDGWQDGDSGAQYGPAWRDTGVRRSRRASSWTAAALIVGVAATSGYFVHAAATPAAAPAGTTSVTQQPGSVTGHGHKPSVTHAVVTSGGSGVTAGSDGSGRDN